MGGAVSFCFCPCHSSASVLPAHPPPVTDPIEAMAACELCQPLHGVWTIYRRPRITRRWVDKDEKDDQADGKR